MKAVLTLAVASLLMWLLPVLVEYIAPGRYGAALNMIIIPVGLGIFIFRAIGREPWILMVSPLVVVAPLLIFLGGDPAKPGLENLVAIILMASVAVGILLGLTISLFGPRNSDA